MFYHFVIIYSEKFQSNDEKDPFGYFNLKRAILFFRKFRIFHRYSNFSPKFYRN